ncbi:MAG: hypothetical protein LBD20_00310 [Spirochaetaceae bacterium]|nr:hypothetical protein [Spirochaetaceae bacterium]
MKSFFYGLIAACTLTFSSCPDKLTFNATPVCTISIRDTNAEVFDMRLTDITKDRFIIIALLKEVTTDWASTLSQEDLTRTAFSVNQIINGYFETKLVKTNLDYWAGNGSYWVAFVMADSRMNEVELGYLSKEKIYFAETANHVALTNLDFMGSVEMKIDISGMFYVPF